MNKQDYQNAIPHACKLKTVQEHMDALGLCWSITYGYVQKANRGVESPQFCHDCEMSVRAKRWDRIWYKKVFGH